VRIPERYLLVLESVPHCLFPLGSLQFQLILEKRNKHYKMNRRCGLKRLENTFPSAREENGSHFGARPERLRERNRITEIRNAAEASAFQRYLCECLRHFIGRRVKAQKKLTPCRSGGQRFTGSEGRINRNALICARLVPLPDSDMRPLTWNELGFSSGWPKSAQVTFSYSLHIHLRITTASVPKRAEPLPARVHL
jgi:hypothetical protein